MQDHRLVKPGARARVAARGRARVRKRARRAEKTEHSRLHCLTLAAAMLPNWAFLPDSRLVEALSTVTGSCIVAGRGERGEGRARAGRAALLLLHRRLCFACLSCAFREGGCSVCWRGAAAG